MKYATLQDLRRAAAQRLPGYLEACLKLGQPAPDGQSLTFSDVAHAKLRRDFAIPRGLGDAVHAIAGPIGRKIKWPCMRGDGTTELKPNSPCAKLRNAMNWIKI